MVKHILTSRFSTIYLGSASYEDVLNKLSNYESKIILGLLTFCEYRINKNLIEVDFIAIENKDSDGITINFDCFKINGLKETSWDAIWHNIRHLVKIVKTARENNEDLHNITSV